LFPGFGLGLAAFVAYVAYDGRVRVPALMLWRRRE
jgi:hypothetical protein